MGRRGRGRRCQGRVGQVRRRGEWGAAQGNPEEEEEEDRGHTRGEGGQAAGGAGGQGGEGSGRETDEHAGGEGRREGEAAQDRREQQFTLGKGYDGCVKCLLR